MPFMHMQHVQQQYGIEWNVSAASYISYNTPRTTNFGRSNMECNGEKVSGDRCLFLLLLNKDGTEESKRMSGKDRLLKAWEFRGTGGYCLYHMGKRS